MKSTLSLRFPIQLALIVSIGLWGNALYAQSGGSNGPGFGGPGMFVDENGDGFNDLAPDADGDGIPNGIDEDYVRSMDGSGNGFGPGTGDCDGSGLGNSRGANHGSGWGGHGYGPGDGSGNGGVRPGDGTGFGPGDCMDTDDVLFRGGLLRGNPSTK